MKAGGGNFGAVVRFCFALHPFGLEVMFALPVYLAADGPGPIRFWRNFLADKSDLVASPCQFSTLPESPDVPAEHRGKRCFTLATTYAGDAAVGERVLAPLRNLGAQAADFSGRMPYAEAQKLFDRLFPAGGLSSHICWRLGGSSGGGLLERRPVQSSTKGCIWKTQRDRRMGLSCALG